MGRGRGKDAWENLTAFSCAVLHKGAVFSLPGLPSQALRASSPKVGALGMSVGLELDEKSTMFRKVVGSTYSSSFFFSSRMIRFSRREI